MNQAVMVMSEAIVLKSSPSMRNRVVRPKREHLEDGSCFECCWPRAHSPAPHLVWNERLFCASSFSDHTWESGLVFETCVPGSVVADFWGITDPGVQSQDQVICICTTSSSSSGLQAMPTHYITARRVRAELEEEEELSVVRTICLPGLWTLRE